jgi:hypothetical protein
MPKRFFFFTLPWTISRLDKHPLDKLYENKRATYSHLVNYPRTWPFEAWGSSISLVLVCLYKQVMAYHRSCMRSITKTKFNILISFFKIY